MSDGANREMTQDDHDLERIMDVLDEAIMSDDPRVEECLRRLMVTVALIRPEGRRGNLMQGPLRQLREELIMINRRLTSLESQINRMNVQSDPLDQWRKRYEQQVWTAPNTITPMPPPTVGSWAVGDPLPGSDWGQGTATDPFDNKKTL